MRLLDVTIRSAHYNGASMEAGAASRRAIQSKKDRYGTGVETLAVEVGGRMPPATCESLRRLATDSSTGS
eukprot:3039640-Karenia_brevis.AAC.1